MSEEADLVDRVYRQLGEDLFGRPTLLEPLAERDRDERGFLTLVMCGAEIDNGGFAQLFTNTTGELARLAVESAEHFGLDRHAALLREAIRLFPGGELAIDHEERLAQWDALCELGDDLDDRLEALDQRWYALGDVLDRRLIAFARQREAGT